VRASEFITEERSEKRHGRWGKLSPELKGALPGMWVQRQLRNTDPYMQYRYGLALAAARGIQAGETAFEQESAWAENFAVVGYAKEDQELIDMADRLMGVKATKMADSASTETVETNIQSPVKPFAGYPR
jgi:hypothetical protein